MTGGKISIAIDGPSGAGKSTISKRLARELGIVHVDTGAMYRALTYKALQEKVDLTDEAALTEMALDTAIEIIPPRNQRDQVIIMDGKDVTEAIRSQEVNRYVSEVAKVPGVRAHLLHLQRKFAEENSVVMDGRDIGTVVLPSADYKFFLTADIETRAKRRCLELYGTTEDEDKLAAVRNNLRHRDEIDSSREYAPLRQAADAILVDTSNLSIDQVVAKIKSYLNR
ncbi:MAG: (d)CMP kinase [Firmicutes bacterium]|nr:(d)CMP kinase [Bacillota bacterium]